MTRKTHSCQQGSPEWLSLRQDYFTASEAPAMMGASKYKTRESLLREKATGLSEEISQAKQRIFDAGHAAEANARPIVEKMIDEELYPVTITLETDGLKLLASMDGLTMLEDMGWENKLLNASLKNDVQNGQLRPHYTYQLEQQLLVSGAKKIFFTTSDGTEEGTFGMWYESNPEMRSSLIAGWKQFAEDLRNYQTTEEQAKAVGRAPDNLPALFIEVTGMVKASNLDAFKSHALAVIGGINTKLTTDEDFADAEKTVKWLKEDVEDRLEAAKQHALSQTASIDELFRAIDSIREEARSKRLTLDKLVKSEKESRKVELIATARNQLALHVDALIERCGVDVFTVNAAIFADAIKGMKSLTSMKEKLGSALANAKIETSALADRVELNRKAVEDMSLVPDFAQVCTKAPDDFKALVAMRKTQRQEAEAKRLEAERERTHQEEVARINAEQEEKAKLAAQEQPAQPILAVVGEIKPDNGPTMKLGEICQRLGYTVSADFLESIGIKVVSIERNSRLYPASAFPAICRRIADHTLSVAFKVAA